jgi:hypothetical protein
MKANPGSNKVRTGRRRMRRRQRATVAALLPALRHLSRPQLTVLQARALTVWARLLQSFVSWLSLLRLARLPVSFVTIGKTHSNGIRPSPRQYAFLLLSSWLRATRVARVRASLGGCWSTLPLSGVTVFTCEWANRGWFGARVEHGQC